MIFLFCQLAPLIPFSSCSWHRDYHKRGTSVKSALICTQVHPINLKVSIKKQELPLFSIEIFWQKKKKKAEGFQFHTPQNTQVFYFSLSTSLREAGLMTSMYAALTHNAIQPSDVCCKPSLSTIRLLLLARAQL